MLGLRRGLRVIAEFFGLHDLVDIMANHFAAMRKIPTSWYYAERAAAETELRMRSKRCSNNIPSGLLRLGPRTSANRKGRTCPRERGRWHPGRIAARSKGAERVTYLIKNAVAEITSEFGSIIGKQGWTRMNADKQSVFHLCSSASIRVSNFLISSFVTFRPEVAVAVIRRATRSVAAIGG